MEQQANIGKAIFYSNLMSMVHRNSCNCLKGKEPIHLNTDIHCTGNVYRKDDIGYYIKI